MYKKAIVHLNYAIKNKLFMQSINTMILRVFGIVVLFGFTFFLTHNYSADLIGRYDFIRTFLLVIGSVAILGTDQSILYFSGVLSYNQNYGELKRVYNKMLVIILVISIFLFAVLLCIGRDRINIFLNDQAIYFVILKAVVVLFFYSVTLFNTEVFRALNIIYTAELFRNTFKYISLIFGAILLLNIGKQQYLVDTFLIGFVVLSIVSTIMIYSFFNKKIVVDEKVNFTYKQIIKKSYPIAISTMAIFLLTTLDIVFLKKFYGDKVLAQYGIAVKFMTIVNMVIQMININSSTNIASLFFTKDFKSLQSTLKNSSRMIVVFVLPVVLITVFFSKEILLLFGSDYLVANRTMKILILGQGLTAFFGLASTYLNMTGKQHYFQFILILAVFLNFFLNQYLIPKFGMEGAAISYIVSMLFWNSISTYIAYKKDRVKIFFH
jgi:O-antigen/teichoic acid export membrane protein